MYKGLDKLLIQLERDGRNNIAEIVNYIAPQAKTDGIFLHVVHGLRVALVAPPAAEKWTSFIRYYGEVESADYIYSEDGLEYSSIG